MVKKTKRIFSKKRHITRRSKKGGVKTVTQEIFHTVQKMFDLYAPIPVIVNKNI